MSLAAFYRSPTPVFSFELFPPKTAEGEAALYEHVAALMELAPRFITCTYGAGGSTRDKTLDIVTNVKRRFGVPVASHLTCVGSTVEQLAGYLREAEARGIDFIVALRGDPPKGETAFKKTEGGLSYASDLVALIKRDFSRFGIAVAGYPEKHQEAASLESDLANLRHKVSCGGDVVITQLFYDNADFFRFERRCRDLGITAPIVPGILPVTNLAQIQRITSLCGARLPADFVARLGERDDADWQFQVGVDFAARQIRELLAGGAPGVHFYVLNKSQAARAVIDAIQS